MTILVLAGCIVFGLAFIPLVVTAVRWLEPRLEVWVRPPCDPPCPFCRKRELH